MNASNPNSKVSVVDSDTHEAARTRRLLNGAGFVVNVYKSGEEFFRDDKAGGVSVLILERALSGISGLEVQERLISDGYNRPIIFLTRDGDLRSCVRAMKNGAIDYLMKPPERSELLMLVHRAIEAGLQEHRVGQTHSAAESCYRRLTLREQQVLRLLCDGRTTKETAAELGVGVPTAWKHRKRVLDKFGVENEVQLVRRLGSDSLPSPPAANTELRIYPSRKFRAGRSPDGFRRVLIVDDHRNGANTLAAVMEETGHEVRVAYDGLAAFEVADGFRPDVAILDIDLPKLNGCDVAKRLRQEHSGRELLLVAVTGSGQEDIDRRCKQAGFDHHFAKPVNLDTLVNLLKQRNG